MSITQQEEPGVATATTTNSHAYSLPGCRIPPVDCRGDRTPVSNSSVRRITQHGVSLASVGYVYDAPTAYRLTPEAVA